jgi:hypothetical protein
MRITFRVRNVTKTVYGYLLRSAVIDAGGKSAGACRSATRTLAQVSQDRHGVSGACNLEVHAGCVEAGEGLSSSLERLELRIAPTRAHP